MSADSIDEGILQAEQLVQRAHADHMRELNEQLEMFHAAAQAQTPFLAAVDGIEYYVERIACFAPTTAAIGQQCWGSNVWQ